LNALKLKQSYSSGKVKQIEENRVKQIEENRLVKRRKETINAG